MKQVLAYIFLALVIISCKQVTRDKVMTVETIESDESIIFAEEAMNEAYKKVDFEKNTAQLNPLINQKLQEYYDLIILERTNSEFSNEIKEQLKKLSHEKLEIDSTLNQVNITNISFLSSPESVSDSIQKIKFAYNNGSKIDSLIAIIKSTPIKIEDQTIWSTQILFEKIQMN